MTGNYVLATPCDDPRMYVVLDVYSTSTTPLSNFPNSNPTTIPLCDTLRARSAHRKHRLRYSKRGLDVLVTIFRPPEPSFPDRMPYH